MRHQKKNLRGKKHLKNLDRSDNWLSIRYIFLNVYFTLSRYFQERRMERKANTLAFKEQKKRLEKEIINKNVNKTVRVI